MIGGSTELESGEPVELDPESLLFDDEHAESPAAAAPRMAKTASTRVVL
jgi:hypothetical protein